jgi:hypothetical protein
LVHCEFGAVLPWVGNRLSVGLFLLQGMAGPKKVVHLGPVMVMTLGWSSAISKYARRGMLEMTKQPAGKADLRQGLKSKVLPPIRKSVNYARHYGKHRRESLVLLEKEHRRRMMEEVNLARIYCKQFCMTQYAPSTTITTQIKTKTTTKRRRQLEGWLKW